MMKIAGLVPDQLPSEALRLGGGLWRVREVSRPQKNTDISVAVDSPEMHVAFPGICKTKDGDLLVVYREGLTHASWEDPRDGHIMLVRSNDLGENWGEPEVLVQTPEHDNRNSAIGCMSDGTLVVCWDKYLPGAHHGAFFITSSDGGHTWSEPIRFNLMDNVHTRSPALELSEEEWLFAVPIEQSCKSEDEMTVYGVIYNRRTGEQVITHITPPGIRHIADECCLTRAADGRIVGLIRSCSDPMLWQTNSFDEGRTWLPPWRSSIPSQFTPADLIALSDGTLLCTFSFRERRNERQCISRDNGETWQVEDSIDVFDGTPPSGDRSYPAAVELEPGIIGTVLYETNPYPEGGRIYFCRTRVADIGANRQLALCQDDPTADGASIVFPAEGDELRVKYRFTGGFGPPPNGLGVDLYDEGFRVLASIEYRLGAMPDRESIPYNWVIVRDGEGNILHDAEATGDWFDDGNEHEMSVNWEAGRLWFSMDGHKQFEGPMTQEPAKVGLRTTRATVAVYS